ncbi:hypothetical protein H6P81_013336 [Aristolochia fimbriata]|uniref:Mitochondrial pyruvate carrier n=1 Tax=Aristolochia fimbriata TaxID=158543 RepID=A0AAV7EEP7_ARIFI|nr:hypothetical protein H6P81_013336 [Aristolochia fimbriata]
MWCDEASKEYIWLKSLMNELGFDNADCRTIEAGEDRWKEESGGYVDKAGGGPKVESLLNYGELALIGKRWTYATNKVEEGQRYAKEQLLMASFRAFLNSPVGPKTTHFWGPVSNMGFILAGLVDTQKPPELISGNMTTVMCIYSGLFMRFAWMIRPRNYMLLGTHVCNETVQLYQLQRWVRNQSYLKSEETVEEKQ